MTSTVTDRIDGVSTSLAIKAPVRAASTANLTLSALQTVDGVVLAAGDRVLVMDQTDATENGIYIADTGDWTRALDFDGNRDVAKGTLVEVTDGTVNAGTYWKCSTANPITIGSSSITFTPALVDDGALVSFLQAGTGAVARDMQSKVRETISITDFGASTAGTAAANRVAIQAAIDAAYGTGKVLIVPAGTFQVNTAGAIVGPVGDALTIADELTIIFEGIVQGTNNCNVVNISAGAADRVHLIGRGGGLQGMARNWDASYATTNNNGCLVRVTTGLVRLEGLRLIDPVQYAVFVNGQDNGAIVNCDFVGGWGTYDATAALGPNDNSYYVRLNNSAHDWSILGCRTLSDGTARKMSQGIGASNDILTTCDRLQVVGCHFLNQWEKGTYLFANDALVSSCVINNCLNEGLRFVGKRNRAIGNDISECAGGGITFYDGERCHGDANKIYNCEGVGITLSYRTTSAGKSLSYGKITNNQIFQKIAGTLLYEGITVQGDSLTGTVEYGIEVTGNTITNADMGTSDRGALVINPANAATAFVDLNVAQNNVDTCGGYGLRFYAGVYTRPDVHRNRVRDAGSQSVALTANRSAFRWETGAVWTGVLSRNHARSETAGSGMSYGFDVVTAANMTNSEILDNYSRGQVTGAFHNMDGVTNTRRGNREGDNALAAAFNATAGATTVITNSNARPGLRVRVIPTNSTAAQIQAGPAMLYHDGTIVVSTATGLGVSFRLGTADGTTVPTTSFSGLYELEHPCCT